MGAEISAPLQLHNNDSDLSEYLSDDRQSELPSTNKFVQYCNGDRYFGPTDSRDVPHGGNGLIFYRDGSAFVGQVQNGKRSGQGTFIHSATDVQYDGGWENDHWNGPGRLYSVHDKTILEGVWKNGELAGEGTRKDLRTGLTWVEKYDNGRLVNQRMVKLSPRSDTSPDSSSQFSSICAGDNDDEVATEDCEHDLGHQVESNGERTSESHESRSNGPTASRVASGTECQITGSPYFASYLDGPRSNGPGTPSPRTEHRFPTLSKSHLTLAAVSNWTNLDVVKWLHSFSTPQAVLDAFIAHEITGVKLLSEISREGLKKDLGIFPYGYRARVMEHLKLLKLQICYVEEKRNEEILSFPVDCHHGHHSPKAAVCNSNLIDSFIIPFGQFQFLELIGVDSAFYSSVYRGRWLGKEIAIKVYTGLLIAPEDWANYVQHLCDIRHPSIVLILGVSSRGPDLHCILMEYTANRSLLDLLCGPELTDILNRWGRRANCDESSACEKAESLLSRLGLRTAITPSFHKHENRSLVTVTSDEAGSAMPLNETTNLGRPGCDEMALLTLGKTQYPCTSRKCDHLNPYLDLLIPICQKGGSSPVDTPLAPRHHGPLSNILVLKIAKGIVLGCLYLQRKGIGHGNLKPSNVLIDESFHVKLTDFGLAKLTKGFTRAPLMVAGNAIGKGGDSRGGDSKGGDCISLVTTRPAKVDARCPSCGDLFDGSSSRVVEPTVWRQRRLQWTPPEVLRVPLTAFSNCEDEKADVYSFGMILWHMLVGLIPFTGMSSTHLRVAVGYAGLRVPLHPVWGPLQWLVGRCLSFSPQDRPTFREILHSLVNINRSVTFTAENALLSFVSPETG